jgi:uncharacterized protein with FMN-binding domain
MDRRVDWHEVSRRAGPPFLAVALLSWAWAWKTGADRPAPDLYPFLKRAWPGATYVPQKNGTVFEVRRDGQILGRATTGSGSGYGGPLTLAVGTTPDGRLHSLALLDYHDTPDLLRRVDRLLGSLLGKPPSDAFEVGRDVDAVTGATYSSRGIAEAARAASRALAEGNPDASATAEGGRSAIGAPEVVLLLLLGAGAVGRHRPSLSARTRSVIRWVALLASLATLGLLWNRPFTIGFPTRLFSGDWPPWTTHLYWYLLFAGVLLAFNRNGKGPYCPSVCPFGAAQDVVSLLGGAHRRRVPSALLFAWVKRVLLWLAVLLGLLYRSPGAASYEVFAAFFRRSGTSFQFVVLGVVLAAALFVRRPFCHWACPVDTLEQALRPVRKGALRLVGRPSALPRPRRPVLVPLEPAERRALPVFRRLQSGALTAAGLLCALLVLGHLRERFAEQGRGAQDGLLGRTFVSSDGPSTGP